MSQIKTYLKKHHAGDVEFHQAVMEVLSDIEDFYESNAKYKRYNILERLIEPDRIIRFRVTWEDDKGDIQVNRAWRVQFNNALGAYKGGMRFHPDVNESVLKFLGFEQCFKNALTGLPMGGAKGGADFNPKGKSDMEVYRFCSALMTELYRHIGPNTDVPAGDIGVGTREIGYLFGQYLRITSEWEGVLTGKAPLFGGSCGRSEATGYGLVYFLKDMLQAHDKEIRNKKVLISGAGNVALHAAEKCLQENMCVQALSDSEGVLYFKDGLNPDQLTDIKKIKIEQHGQLTDYDNGEYNKGASIWDIEADIALPCAIQNEINADTAQKLVKNGIFALTEGANMPCTSDAQKILMENKIIYGPGKAANAGGVAVSGMERTQNAQMQAWSLKRVDKELRQIMKQTHDRITQNINKENGIYPYRKGANIESFRQLANTLLAYGLK